MLTKQGDRRKEEKTEKEKGAEKRIYKNDDDDKNNIPQIQWTKQHFIFSKLVLFSISSVS